MQTVMQYTFNYMFKYYDSIKSSLCMMWVRLAVAVASISWACQAFAVQHGKDLQTPELAWYISYLFYISLKQNQFLIQLDIL